MNVTRQVLAYADDLSLMGYDIITILRNANVNKRKIKHMEVGRHQGLMANQHIAVGSHSYEQVKTFKYLGSLLTSKSYSRGNKM